MNFTLRQLLVAVGLIAGLCAVTRFFLTRPLTQSDAIQSLQEHGVSVDYPLSQEHGVSVDHPPVWIMLDLTRAELHDADIGYIARCIQATTNAELILYDDQLEALRNASDAPYASITGLLVRHRRHADVPPSIDAFPNNDRIGVYEKSFNAASLSWLSAVSKIKGLEFEACHFAGECALPSLEAPSLSSVKFFKCRISGDALLKSLMLHPLKEIEFFSCNVEHSLASPMSLPASISSIQFEDTAVTAEQVRNFGSNFNPSGYSNEVFVDFSGSSIRDDAMAHIAAWPLLRLSLSGSKVSDLGVSLLQSHASLQEIDLNGTGVTDASLEALVGNESLGSLHVERTLVTKDGIEQFRRKRRQMGLVQGHIANTCGSEAWVMDTYEAGTEGE